MAKFLYFSIPWLFLGPFQAVSILPTFLQPFHPCWIPGGEFGKGRKPSQHTRGGRSLPSFLVPRPPSRCSDLPDGFSRPGWAKEELKHHLIGFWVCFFLFPMDPFPASFCFQAGKFFEEASAQSSSYPKSRGSLDLLPHWCDPSVTRLPQTTEFLDPIPSS